MRLSSILLRGAGVLLPALSIIGSSSAQSACSISLNAGEEGTVTVRRGEVVTVCLPLNSGTGYSWSLGYQDGSDFLTWAPTSTYEREGTMPGAKGTVRFSVNPQTAGDYTLKFMLMPPGNNPVAQGRAIVSLKVQ